MKNQLLFILTFLLIAVSADAQGGFMDKMKKFAGEEDTIGTVNGATYTITGNGVVSFANGTTQEGTIRYQVTSNPLDMRAFYFTPAMEMKEKYIRSKDVDHFVVNGHSFYLIKVKTDDVAIGNEKIFVEMVNGSPDDYFKMYRLRKMEPNTSGIGSNSYDLRRGYFVLFPHFKVAHEITDLTFTPFAKKMSEFLKDCPDLAKKIKDKEQGYKVNMFNGAANDEIFLRVMEEYNSCPK